MRTPQNVPEFENTSVLLKRHIEAYNLYDMIVLMFILGVFPSLRRYVTLFCICSWRSWANN